MTGAQQLLNGAIENLESALETDHANPLNEIIHEALTDLYRLRGVIEAAA